MPGYCLPAALSSVAGARSDHTAHRNSIQSSQQFRNKYVYWKSPNRGLHKRSAFQNTLSTIQEASTINSQRKPWDLGTPGAELWLLSPCHGTNQELQISPAGREKQSNAAAPPPLPSRGGLSHEDHMALRKQHSGPEGSVAFQMSLGISQTVFHTSCLFSGAGKATADPKPPPNWARMETVSRGLPFPTEPPAPPAVLCQLPSKWPQVRLPLVPLWALWLLWGLLFPHVLLVSLRFNPALRGDHFLRPMRRRPNQGLDVIIVYDFLLQEGVCQLNIKERVSSGADPEQNCPRLLRRVGQPPLVAGRMNRLLMQRRKDRTPAEGVRDTVKDSAAPNSRGIPPSNLFKDSFLHGYTLSSAGQTGPCQGSFLALVQPPSPVEELPPFNSYPCDYREKAGNADGWDLPMAESLFPHNRAGTWPWASVPLHRPQELRCQASLTARSLS